MKLFFVHPFFVVDCGLLCEQILYTFFAQTTKLSSKTHCTSKKKNEKSCVHFSLSFSQKNKWGGFCSQKFSLRITCTTFSLIYSSSFARDQVQCSTCSIVFSTLKNVTEGFVMALTLFGLGVSKWVGCTVVKPKFFPTKGSCVDKRREHTHAPPSPSARVLFLSLTHTQPLLKHELLFSPLLN